MLLSYHVFILRWPDESRATQCRRWRKNLKEHTKIQVPHRKTKFHYFGVRGERRLQALPGAVLLYYFAKTFVRLISQPAKTLDLANSSFP